MSDPSAYSTGMNMNPYLIDGLTKSQIWKGLRTMERESPRWPTTFLVRPVATVRGR